MSVIHGPHQVIDVAELRRYSRAVPGTASPIMRDHALPSKRQLLAGRHNRVHVLVEVNLDHCFAAAMVGLLVGFLAWHNAPPAPTKPASPYYQKFEVEIPQ